jgi:hypothetical protein
MSGFLLLTLVVSLALVLSVSASVQLSIYECSSCRGAVDHHLTAHPAANSVQLLSACRAAFPDSHKLGPDGDVCNLFAAHPDTMTPVHNSNARDTCAAAGYCPSEPEEWRRTSKQRAAASGAFFDVRVAKAMGSRGYDKVRLSGTVPTQTERRSCVCYCYCIHVCFRRPVLFVRVMTANDQMRAYVLQ